MRGALAALAALAGAMLSSGCAGEARPAPAAGVRDWRSVATNDDRARLRGWRDSWIVALRALRTSGRQRELSSGGALFDPDAARDGVTPPVGAYRCRVYKLGIKGSTAPGYAASPSHDCRIDRVGDVLHVSKVGGIQRPAGILYPESDTRAVFLGTLVLGDETKALRYGQDATRDIAGVFERIGDARWRLVLPAPAFQSRIDIVEFTPA